MFSPYMGILLFSLSVPLIFSFWPPLKFYRHVRALFYSIGIIVLLFGGWDIFATYRGHWDFSPSGVYPFRVINLPLEEVLFFVVIPFCCVFTWESLKYIKRKFR
jgi:lycopene cyclase domain-containing protein